MEVWKCICGYEGSYQVSNLGNVRSLNYRRTGKVKNLVPKKNNCGRLWVDLKGKPFLIHRLVAEAFIPNRYNLPQINHKDENPKNNKVDNLEWCSGEYNRMQYIQNHSDYGRKRERLENILQLNLDGTIVREWNCVRDIVAETGMNQWSITQCCDGKRKTAYGFRWRYAI